MYLMYDDDELAGQAFSRSQANDPENAVAWLGQAVLAIRANDPGEAHELLVHSFEIGESSFVSTTLEKLLTARLRRCIALLKRVSIKLRLEVYYIYRFLRLHFLR